MNYEGFNQETKSEHKMNMNYNEKMEGYKDANMYGCCDGMMATPMMGGCCQPCQPIYECPRENVCHRYICYEVPHIMPCNTRIINHHIYRHTYTPEYTCCEENVVQNVYDRCC